MKLNSKFRAVTHFLLVLSICISLFSSVVFADTSLIISGSDVTGKPGSTVSIPISLKNVPETGIQAGTLWFNYDKTKFVFKGFTAGTICYDGNNDIVKPSANASPIIKVLYSDYNNGIDPNTGDDAQTKIAQDGVIGTIKLQIVAGTNGGSYPITLSGPDTGNAFYTNPALENHSSMVPLDVTYKSFNVIVDGPTPTPTATPTAEPTATPTAEPTATPTAEPTATPTAEPTATPTAEPTATPTAEPTATPTAEPTATPTAEPTATPTAEPTATPTAEPTATPTDEPTATPTATPTAEPTATPTAEPTATPTAEPTATPTPEITATPVPTLTPAEINVDACSLSDITINIGENKLYSIKNGTGTLISDVDYTYSGNTVIINKWYLNYYFTKFPNHNLYLDFNYESGNSSRLTVYTGSTPHVAITESLSYEVNSGDAQLNLVLNGNFINSITNGDESLIQRVDFTYAPSTQTLYIRKGYLNKYFSNTSEPLKLTVNFTGDTKTVVITPVK